MVWNKVKLSEVAKQRKQFILIDDMFEYKRCRVQLHAKGIILRDIIVGSEIKTKYQQVCRAGEFLVAEIDAKVGGFGIVPEELDGAIVSSHYFLFTIDDKHLDRKFLDYFIRTPAFREQVNAQGSTNYAAIRPSHVLGYMIPLPPLSEQQRIVSKIKGLVLEIEEVRTLHRRISEECNALLMSILSADSKAEICLTQMRDLVTLREPDIAVIPSDTYHFAGVYCFGKGVFSGERKTGLDFAYKTLTRLRAGDFVYPKLMAWEGALGIVPQECDGLYVSPEYPVFAVNEERVLPETLDVYFRFPSVWPQLAEISTGTNVRRRRLHPNRFLSYKIPLPPMEIQKKLQEVQSKVDSIKSLQSKTTVEIDALLPSILDKAFKGEL
jgi:type I restriction enzyme, S subunit